MSVGVVVADEASAFLSLSSFCFVFASLRWF